MMNWKDWLYIPKSDKVAIASLSIIIALLLGIHFIISQKPSVRDEITIPDDYKAWQVQLTQKKEEEKETYFEEHKKDHHPYLPKMKVGETIELNSADTTQLKIIPGIGSGYANRIAKYRTSLGGFAHIEQLEEVWGNRTISNAKKMLLGVHHNCINNQYVQNYLDEFCYKFNRRYFGDKLSDRLLIAALENTWY